MKKNYKVIIIGAGPAGLAAARALKDAGVQDLLLIERESQAGGVPRHCQHPTFGLLTYFRPMKGNTWIKKILQPVKEIPLRTDTTVISIRPGGFVDISSDNGLETLQAKRVIIATGVRETPRHARLISGLRPQGVLTAGALQQFIYLRKLKPGNRSVIVGSELVSFSALWTLYRAGIKPVALVDEHPRPVAFRLSTLLAHLLRVPVHFNTRVSHICGSERVEGMDITDKRGKTVRLDCDSVIFTGKFVGEYTLILKSHLQHDKKTGRPLFDQHGCCSDRDFYAVGNMTHPADMGDQCYQEGLQVGKAVALALQEEQPTQTDNPVLPIEHQDIIRMSAPAVIRLGGEDKTATLNIRVSRPVSGEVVVRDGRRELYRRRHRCMPERRILLKNINITHLTSDSTLSISIE
ncbi:FAD-dependent oxidoreductase [Sodalis sp. RH15]|uniref:FAD-dependent oxidoreductase n=1 Tax=Sodalis sp. RH15 TaxID=3394330 RepID=UPI0039B47EE9